MNKQDTADWEFWKRMALSRKHYRETARIIEKVANTDWVLENAQASTGVETCALVAEQLANLFVSIDPHFDRNWFLAAT